MPNLTIFDVLTRLGFAARALTYGAIGYLTLRLGRTEDNQGALSYLQGTGGGILLGVMALGFFGYGVWRVSEAIIDSEGQGTGGKGIATRVGGAVSGIIHLILCWAATQLALGLGSKQSGDKAEQGASAMMSFPGGTTALLAVAAVLLGIAAAEIVKAVKLGFLKHLDPRAARQAWIGWVGRAGYLARGAVFAATAFFMWRAGMESRAAEAGGMDQALDSFPAWLRVMVAAGLLMFGLFSLVEAIYRRINDPEVIARLKRRFG